MIRWCAGLWVLLLVSCEWETYEKEVGYRGPARVNPWLAAERFAGRMGYDVVSEKRWRKPRENDAIWFVPSAMLRTRSYAGPLEEWAKDGGHVVLLLDHASATRDDWAEHPAPYFELEIPVREWFGRLGVKIITPPKSTGGTVKIGGEHYSTTAGFRKVIDPGDGKPVAVHTVRTGYGAVTLVGDAAFLRNRWLGEGENAAALAAILALKHDAGTVVFLRGNAASLWEMVRKFLWAPLVGLGIGVGIWLWRNLVRFGPIDHAPEVAVLRGYEHHLAALGNFQWKVDRAESLMRPLRETIVENGQRLAMTVGRRDDSLFDFLADRAAISPEEVRRALTMKNPADGADLTSITATLQKLLQVLQPPSRS